MAGCCGHEPIKILHARQRQILRMVFVINAVMFVCVLSVAIYANSSALLSDSFDNFGDAFTFALSLYAVSGSGHLKAKVALVKGLLIFLAACAVAVQIGFKLVTPVVPVYGMMMIFSILGVVANGVSVFLLMKHKDDDINMSSVWHCARNDIASNLSVLLAAVGVWYFEAGWPDVVVAACLLMLLLRSSWLVVSAAMKQLVRPE